MATKNKIKTITFEKFSGYFHKKIDWERSMTEDCYISFKKEKPKGKDWHIYGKVIKDGETFFVASSEHDFEFDDEYCWSAAKAFEDADEISKGIWLLSRDIDNYFDDERWDEVEKLHVFQKNLNDKTEEDSSKQERHEDIIIENIGALGWTFVAIKKMRWLLDRTKDGQTWIEEMNHFEEMIMNFKNPYKGFLLRAFYYSLGEEGRFFEIIIQNMLEKDLISIEGGDLTFEMSEKLDKIKNFGFDHNLINGQDWRKRSSWSIRGNGEAISFYESITFKIEGFHGNFTLECGTWEDYPFILSFYPGEE